MEWISPEPVVSFREQKLAEFARHAAERTPTPGGGAVSAVVGALGAAMGAMAARFTTGRKRYADIAEDMKALADELDKTREKLLTLADDDSQAYSAVAAAMARPKSSSDERTARDEAIRKAARAALEPPLAAAHQAFAALKGIRRLCERFNENLASDVAVAAHSLAAALAGSVAQVEVNLSVVADDALTGRMVPEIESMRAGSELLLVEITARTEQITAP